MNVLRDKGLTKGVCPECLRLIFKCGVLMLNLSQQHATRALSIVCVLLIISTPLNLVL